MHSAQPDTAPARDHWPTVLDRDGACVVADLADAATVETLLTAVEEATDENGSSPAERHRRGKATSFARRNVLEIPAVAAFATRDATLRIVRRVPGDTASLIRPVRGLLFDKTPDANWTVPWHQDRSIAVRERIETDGYGPWSTKAGVVHVQPPIEVLQQMVTLRLALDSCGYDNGPLRIVPGTHTRLLTAAEVDDRTRSTTAVPSGRALICRRGDAVLMRPLVLHASSPATSPDHRRVLHLEYGACALPGGLRWHHEVSCS